ncbi:MAG: HPr family phosphocarrier protein [Selenomonadaceae bacterium]|nr:HPr family phosphocarrier protein [Selenomonadaceae bacterium]
MTKKTFVIDNNTGIHARPASLFVQAAAKFKSKVEITAKGRTIDAKSIIMVMGMGLVKGTEVTISAEGPDEKTAVKDLVALVLSFKENDKE